MIVGADLLLYPTDRAAGTYEYFSIQPFTPLSTGTDVPFGGTGVPDQYWTELAIVDAAIKCLQKEESDVSVLMAQKQALRQRIISAAAQRNVSEPARILDSDDQTPAWPWWSR